MDLSFAVHKLAKFSANTGKVHFEGFIHLLRYIRDNKTLGLKYYADLNDAPVTDLLRQANIKTKNHLMAFSDSSWQDCPDTGRITGAYIISIKVGQLIMAHMFRYQLLNLLKKVSTMKHALQECIQHISGC